MPSSKWESGETQQCKFWKLRLYNVNQQQALALTKLERGVEWLARLE